MMKLVIAGRVYWSVGGIVYTSLTAAQDAIRGAR